MDIRKELSDLKTRLLSVEQELAACRTEGTAVLPHRALPTASITGRDGVMTEAIRDGVITEDGVMTEAIRDGVMTEAIRDEFITEAEFIRDLQEIQNSGNAEAKKSIAFFLPATVLMSWSLYDELTSWTALDTPSFSLREITPLRRTLLGTSC